MSLQSNESFSLHACCLVVSIWGVCWNCSFVWKCSSFFLNLLFTTSQDPAKGWRFSISSISFNNEDFRSAVITGGIETSLQYRKEISTLFDYKVDKEDDKTISEWCCWCLLFDHSKKGDEGIRWVEGLGWRGNMCDEKAEEMVLDRLDQE